MLLVKVVCVDTNNFPLQNVYFEIDNSLYVKWDPKMGDFEAENHRVEVNNLLSLGGFGSSSSASLVCLHFFQRLTSIRGTLQSEFSVPLYIC